MSQYEAYQLFEPVTAPDKDCQKLLPLNEISSTLFFYKVTAFQQPLDRSIMLDEEQDAHLPDFQFMAPVSTGMASATMALPIGYLNLAYTQCTDSRIVHTADGQMPLVVGLDRTFLPSTEPDKLLPQKIPDLVIDDIDDLSTGSATIGNFTLMVSETTREILWEYGKVYVAIAESPGKARLVLRADEYEVADASSLYVYGRMASEDGEPLDVDMTESNWSALRESGRAFAKVNGRPVNLRVSHPRRTETSPTARAGLASTQSRLPSQGLDFEEPLIVERPDFPGIVPPELTVAQPDVESIVNDMRWQSGELTRSAYCSILRMLLGDPRATIYSHGYTLSEVPKVDRVYFMNLQTFMRDPRFASCGASAPVKAATPELPVYEIGILTTYKQDWKLLGYSRGALLSSITLAPREEVQVEVFSWDRLKVEEEQSFGSEYESNRESSVMARASTTIAHELNETLGTTASVDGGISAPLEYVNLDAGLTGSAASNVHDNLTSTLDTLHEATVKGAERFKTTHQVKIVQTREIGTETKSIRRFQNPNAAHTLTLNHFEILENYEVTTSLADTKKYCVLVENEDLAFDIDFILAHQNRLEKVLLSPTYKAGFEAARLLAGQRWFDGESALKMEQGLGDENSGRSKTGKLPSNGVFGTANQILRLLEQFLKLSPKKMGEVLRVLAEHHTWLKRHSSKQVQTAQHDITMYSFWAKLNLAYPGFDTRAQKYVAAMKQLERTVDDYEERHLRDEIVNELSLLTDGFDDDWLYHLKMLAVSLVIGEILTFATMTWIALAVGPILTPLVLIHNDCGLPKAISRARKQLKPYRQTREAVTLKEAAGATANATGEASQQVVAGSSAAVPQVYSLQDLANAHADFTRLKLHLEAHRIYYQNEVWRTEDPNERLYRLSLHGLAPYVENRLLGFCGKKAVYSLRVGALPKHVVDELDLYLDYDTDDVGAPPEMIALPTSGVHMEPVLGKCSAIEPYLEERRAIDLYERQAKADQEALEARRLEERLAQSPPLLDDPFRAAETDLSLLSDSETDDIC